MRDRLIRTAADMMAVLKSRVAVLGWTHIEVEFNAGLADGHWSKLCNGDRTPNLQTLARLYQALDLAFVPIVVETARSCSDGETQVEDVVVNGDGDGKTTHQRTP
jgi:transcriptional regulator with XRE-family HTH domain